jgi:glycosyltransferase involved in cell wall biosynthesis
LIKPGDIVQLRLALLEVIDMDFNTLSVKKNKCHELIKSQYLWGNIIKKTIDQLEEKLKTLL